MNDHRDALDEAIDEVAHQLVAAPPDEFLLTRLTASLGDRRPPSRLPRLTLATAVGAIALAIGGAIVQRAFIDRSTEVQPPSTAQASNARVPVVEPAVNAGGTPVERSSNDPGTIVARSVRVRRTVAAPSSNNRESTVEEDFSPFPPVSVAALAVSSLETGALDDAPGDVSPLVIDELPAMPGLLERQ